ncbi:SDR family oxidoreductase [Clostridium sp. SM-530-WT-3G]|uniref:SDR family NAD(P)-dependent oxidoreductase n=1 Tax=Clostridium sp. SM-530-WT-3G TaxID=2725303 RepID=UPI00145DD98F|nr:SDR family oxidoreductase [Clostridium sp. SM-530-WT-3G]NME82784.1 SDR family oxidoreductase [Clostridium sp. SM-530-WT-3G]
MRLLENKNIFITGCNRGIGKKLVEVFAQNGANTIIAHARKKSDEYEQYLIKVKNKYNIVIIPVYFDLVNYDDMKREIRKLQMKEISIDVLVNNAGIAHGGLFQMTSVNKIKEVFDVNFFSVLELTQLILKFMKKQSKGAIINVSSVSGLDLKRGNCAYGTSKAALIAFTRTLAAELAPIRIRVNAIAPGLTDTDMAKLMEINAKKEMIREISMGRLGKTEEIADAIVFLASDRSSFITGQVLRVDGGII